MSTKLAPLCAAVLLLAAGAVQAQSRPVYRCGNGVYQHTPCEGGSVVASPTQTAAQRAEARRVAAAERELAERKRKEKAAADAAAKAARAASAPAAPVAAVPAAAPATAKKAP
jgi:hypothetical protein